MLALQRGEAETGAAGLKRGDDLADVVAEETETGGAGVLLDDCRRKGGEGAKEGDERARKAEEESKGTTLRRSKVEERRYSPRLRANCASFVMASASSRMMSLTPLEKSFRVPAKDLIWSRTTSIPRSSDAFSSSTICRHCLGP